eukprot:6601013-Lingulodinium_polyedra.AAC.1
MSTTRIGPARCFQACGAGRHRWQPVGVGGTAASLRQPQRRVLNSLGFLTAQKSPRAHKQPPGPKALNGAGPTEAVQHSRSRPRGKQPRVPWHIRH